MKKILFMFVFIGLLVNLSACMEPSIDRLKFSLNPGVDTVEINTSFVDAGAKATYGFRNIDVKVISNNVDITKTGEYEIIYHVSYLDFEKTLTRKVTVVDESLPVVTLNPGLDTIYVGDPWLDRGVHSDETIDVEASGTVDINTPGEYIITYTITDFNGQELIIYRYVNVIER